MKDEHILGIIEHMMAEIDNEVSVILQHSHEVKHTSEKASEQVKNYREELSKKIDTFSREDYLTNVINDIKAVGKENFGSARNIEQASQRIDRALKEIKKLLNEND